MTARAEFDSRLPLSAYPTGKGSKGLDFHYPQALFRGLATVLAVVILSILSFSVPADAGNVSSVVGPVTQSLDVAVLSSSSLSVAERRDTTSFSVFYRVAVSEIERGYHGNAASLDSAAATLRKIVYSRDLRIHMVVIIGAASPEGPENFNSRLARDRAGSVKAFLRAIEPRLEDPDFILVSRGEDWEGAARMAESYGTLPGDGSVSGIFSGKMSSGEKKQKMKSLDGGKVWREMISTYYPALRRSDIYVLYGTVNPIASVKCPVAPIATPYSQELATRSRDTEEAAPVEAPVETRVYSVAVKTNLLYDLGTAVNFELEFPLGNNFSVMFEDVCPWWKWGPNGKKYCFQVWSMGVEPRWWFRRDDRRDYLSGHFAGAYGMSGKYDLQWDTKLCYQGEFWSAGLTYGYAMPVCKWMNMEFSASLGYLRTDYRHYQPDSGYDHLYRDKYKAGTASWFGPTKLKVSLVIPVGKVSHS